MKNTKMLVKKYMWVLIFASIFIFAVIVSFSTEQVKLQGISGVSFIDWAWMGVNAILVILEYLKLKRNKAL